MRTRKTGMLIAAMIIGLIGAIIVLINGMTCGLCTAALGDATGYPMLTLAGWLMLGAGGLAVIGAALSLANGGLAGFFMLLAFLAYLAAIILFTVFYRQFINRYALPGQEITVVGAFLFNIVGFIGSILVFIGSILAFAGRGRRQ